ncbi:MAG: aldo/keto reductase [Blautia sp.]
MEFITLNNGIEMPILGYGTFLSNGDECEQSVCKAIQAGYRLIDTAEAYGNEVQVGKGIRLSGIDRKELFIVTKVNFKSYENTRETVLNSLKYLNTDYLDLVLLHWPFGNYYQAWRELEQLYKEKKIRAIGVSNFDPDRLVDLIHFNEVVPAINQIETNVFCQRQAEHEWLEKYHVKHMAYAPLGQGQRNEMFSNAVIVELAEKYQKTPAQIMLRFLTQQNIIAIPKSTNELRIQENIDVFNFTLSNEEQNVLRGLDQKKAMIGTPENPDFVESAMKW